MTKQQSEGEVHVEAMRLILAAMERREDPPDWTIWQHMLSMLETIFQGIEEQRRDDQDELFHTRRNLDAKQAEMVRLRVFVGKARETISRTMNYCDVEFLLSALAELDAGTIKPAPCPGCEQLRAALAAAKAAQALWQADSKLLARFVATVRSRFNPGWTEDDLPAILSAVSAVFEALAELDAGPSEPTPVAEPAPCPDWRAALAELDAGTIQPAQVAEPVDPDTRGQELERLYSAIDGDLLAEGISNVCREIGEARKRGAEHLDAEGGA